MRDFGVSYYFAELDSMHVPLTLYFDVTGRYELHSSRPSATRLPIIINFRPTLSATVCRSR